MTNDIMRRAIVHTRLLVNEHPALYTFGRRLRGRDDVFRPVNTSDTDIYIEGFQASANSFTFNVVRELSDELNIAHHCHTVASVKLALRREVPALILFRDLAEAVPSAVAQFRPDPWEAAYM